MRIVSRDNYEVTSPLAIVGDVVVVGSSIGDNGRTDLERGVRLGAGAPLLKMNEQERGLQAAVWAAEAYAAHAASVAGARAGAIAGGTAEVASSVTLRTLSASLVGVVPRPWCPGATRQPPPVWLCQ